MGCCVVVGELDTKGGDGALAKQRRDRELEGQRVEGAERRVQEAKAKATRKKSNKMLMLLLAL